MAFLGFGAVVSLSGWVPEQIMGGPPDRLLHLLAEVALVVLLFLDAAKINTLVLTRWHSWPMRMLLLGMPLAMLFSAGLAAALFPGWPLTHALLIAAILTPTDLALGQPVVSNPDVPERARDALTTEGGLNDGMALPVILMLAFLAAPVATAPDGGWALFGLEQITLGPLAGMLLGCIGGIALLAAQARGWTSETHEGIAALSLAALAYLTAVSVGGNGFIGAFSAGLVFGAVVKDRCAFVFEFTESEGQFLAWAAFFLLGATLLPGALAALDLQMLALVLGTLFVTRPAAIWLSLMGSGAIATDRLFFGWFGPHGLATALFALLVVDQLAPEFGEQVLHVAVNTVWISALLHGLSAGPGARWYARKSRDATGCSGLAAAALRQQSADGEDLRR
jgi:NhaP-type Na+/H+ or K+/H+ antiporter